MRRRWIGSWAAALVLLASPPVTGYAAEVLGDVLDGIILAASESDTPIDTDLVSALLLVETIREGLAAGALTAQTPIALATAPPEDDRALARHRTLPLGELLQLLLLTRSRLAAGSLARLLAPEPEDARTRLQATAARLGLAHTMLGAPPFGEDAAGAADRTTPSDLARLGLAIAADPDLRRRLTLDGVPIADGDLIIRLTAPLIAVAPPPRTARPSIRQAALAVAREDGLDLLAVATGADADRAAWAILETARARYERVTIIREGQAIGPMIEVRSGIIPHFNAIAAEPFAVTLERGAPPRLGLRVQVPPSVDAPVEVRQAIGELVIDRRDRIVAVIPLVAPRAIAPSRWLDATVVVR